MPDSGSQQQVLLQRPTAWRDEGAVRARRAASPVRWMVAATITIAIGVFLSVLDSAIVGVAYPAIEHDLGATAESTQWITTAYKLTQGVVIPAAVWLCRRFGLYRMYLVSLLGYAVSSALCATAGTIDELVAFRVLQAVPGALTPIVCVGIIYALIPKRAQSAAFAIYALIAISAPGFAPYVGGCLVEFVHWRAVFWVAVPLSLLGVAAAAMLLPPMRPTQRPPRFDLAGFVCIAVGSAALLLVLSKGAAWGWTSYSILGLLLLGVNALIVFVAVELRVPSPLFDLRIFASRPFVVALLVLEVMFVSVNSVISFLPVFLEQAQLMTPSQAGAVLIPQALAWLVGIVLSALLWMLFGARTVTILGLLCMAWAMWQLSGLTVDMTRGTLAMVLAVHGVGLGLVMVPMLSGAIAVLPVHLLPDGITFRTIVQRTTASLGLAGLSVLVTVHREQRMTDQSGLLDLRSQYRIPQLEQMHDKGPDGMVPLWESLQGHSLTAAYADAYLAVAIACLVAVGVTLCANWPRPPRPVREQMVEVGV